MANSQQEQARQDHRQALEQQEREIALQNRERDVARKALIVRIRENAEILRGFEGTLIGAKYFEILREMEAAAVEKVLGADTKTFLYDKGVLWGIRDALQIPERAVNLAQAYAEEG